MAVSNTGTPATGRVASTTSHTISLTIPAGASRVVATEGGFNNSATYICSAVTLNSSSMTQIGSNIHDGGRHASMWEMRDSDANWPGTGTFNVTFTIDNGRDSIACAFCLTGDDDVAAENVGSTTTASSTPSITVTSATGDLVAGVFITFSAARTAAGPDTELYWYAGGGSAASGYTFTNAGAASVTFDSAYASSVSVAGIAANFPAAAGGGGANPKGVLGGVVLRGPFGGPLG